ncbi:MAG: chromosome segregation protein [Frankiales bacterium]|jgi:chromosome segregation protein|nr:chromosome segregation protein [Frankiales bacterium]
MHLKSLTLRGFKSFASSTTLRFEPGITCVVGPNGSGKSNIVDALAWVMGEQGAKTLRGGKMEDVIFAGTAGRPALGRAEVVLTIDNADGALPIDYTEVTISRLMFRSGHSEYAINGTPCRLLDVQELLNDSGMGREMHVIVGQGQLDQVLSAGPEERRAFIEEAAGVLKHRKRKEKALRKLDAMQANLTRLQDLTTELRRQLGPLGRQAEVARKAATIQSDLRDSRLRLLADDLFQLREALEAEVRDETAMRDRRSGVEQSHAAAQQRELELEAEMTAEAPRVARSQETWYRLASLRERLRGTAGLATERARHAASPDTLEEAQSATPARDPEALEKEAATVRDQESALAGQLDRDHAALAGAVATREGEEAALAAEEQRLREAALAVADRREGLARLTGDVGAARTRVAAGEDEIGRLSAALTEARQRAAEAQNAFTALETQVAGLDEGEVNLDERYEEAAAVLAEAERAVAELQAEEREAERERSALTARREALELGLARRDGAGALLAAGDEVGGVLGSLAALLTIEPGAEAAVAAALGAAADAVAVESVDSAIAAIELLRATDAGRAGIVVGGTPYDDNAPSWPALPGGARWAIDLVETPEHLRPTIVRLLDRVAVVTDLATARSLLAAESALRAVTREGDLIGAMWAAGGSQSTPSPLELQSALDEAGEALTAASHRCDRLTFALSAAEEVRAAAAVQVEAELTALHESDARMSAVAERLGQLGSAARASAEEADRLAGARAAAEEARERDLATVSALEERLAAARSSAAEADITPSTEERDRCAARCDEARHLEVEARLAVRTGEERARALHGRAEALERAAADERATRARFAATRERRAREGAVARAVAIAARYALDRIEQSLTLAAAEREAAEQQRTVREGELLAVRARGRELAGELEQLTDVVHRDEVARTEQRLRIESLEARAAEEFGVDAETLVAEYGPTVLVPVAPDPDAPEDEPLPEPIPYIREQQEKRARSAERSLALLGRVNPLALEEFTALEERQRFLTEQLEDLKNTRRDLLTVIKEVDERVEQVFRAAFEDTAREFESVFSTLFPGGTGKLVLTEPDDMLTTGIEVEARPPGKKIKRLSLLSGGERSLTAIAFLIALFRARPSPFYVLDEVEAALDDTNLGRLLQLFSELQTNSQVIVVTHQKRTMEIADALYGVSMRGDGVTTVISQRLRELESEPA